jgi:iron complex transport system ATP-binding protein
VGVHARYRSDVASGVALRGVDLQVRPGEMVAIIGPNGAGKSTLVRVASGTLRPESGEVRLFGRSLAEIGPSAVARELAVVHQRAEVAFGFRVEDVVLMGRAPHQGRLHLPGPEDRAIVADAMQRAGIVHLAGRRVDELSGGEQQLVAVARALAQQPRVLLLDEATAHLDVRHAVDLYERVMVEVETRQLACVAVVHDLNLAAVYAHRVVLLCDGRVDAAGKVEEVMTWKRLRDAFGVDLYVGVNELDGTRYFVPRRARSGAAGAPAGNTARAERPV